MENLVLVMSENSRSSGSCLENLISMVSYLAITEQQKRHFAIAIESEISDLRQCLRNEYEKRYIVGRELLLEVIEFDINELQKEIKRLLQLLRDQTIKQRFDYIAAESLLDLNDEELLRYAMEAYHEIR